MKQFTGLNKVVKGILTVALILAPVTSFAAVQSPFVNSDDSKELDLNYIAELIAFVKTEQNFSATDYIPMNMKAGSSEETVASNIFSHALSNWIRNNKNSSVGQLASQIENPISGEIQINNGKSNSHQIRFDVNASQTEASIKYKGAVQAKVSYQIAANQFGVEISQDLNNSSRLVLDHKTDSQESVQMVSLQISW